MFHAVGESVTLAPFPKMFCAACMVRTFGCPGRWDQMFCRRSAMAAASIAGVAVAVAAGSLVEVVGTAKNVVAVKAKSTPTAPPLIRHAPRAEAVVRSAGKPSAGVDDIMNGCAAIAKEATNSIAPLPREATAEPIEIVCSDIPLVRNAAFV